MPIYEYRCAKCGHHLEALQKISDAPLVQCPACGEEGLTKLVSAASFRLKGGGWYETDFKQDKRKQLADRDDAPSPGADTGKDGNKDTGKDSSKDTGKNGSKDAGKSADKTSAGGSSKGSDKTGQSGTGATGD